jgi:hypothetical protein
MVILVVALIKNRSWIRPERGVCTVGRIRQRPQQDLSEFGEILMLPDAAKAVLGPETPRCSPTFDHNRLRTNHYLKF